MVHRYGFKSMAQKELRAFAKALEKFYDEVQVCTAARPLLFALYCLPVSTVCLYQLFALH